MITLMLVVYSFLAGMTAEYCHDMLTEKNKLDGRILTALVCGAIWPYTLWRAR
ncbi:L-alanine exporter AlaE [Erwinia mallotivora]|uniref:L-alanine exporter AlaE n=1 Tax=Erwinia mallotivora TaxID=69222 RepID=UPI0021BE93D3|nr:L-alanine exporter AlaE [Erwinia mallotivora]